MKPRTAIFVRLICRFGDGHEVIYVESRDRELVERLLAGYVRKDFFPGRPHEWVTEMVRLPMDKKERERVTDVNYID